MIFLQKRHFLTNFFFLVLFFCPIGSYGLTEITIEKGKEKFPAGKYLEILEDKEGKWSAGRVNSEDFQNKWKKSGEEAPNLGFSSSVYWIRFYIANPEELNKVFLEYSYPPLDLIEFFALDRDNRILFHKIAGDSISYEGRDILYKNVIFDIEAHNKEIKTYLVKIKTTSSVNIDITLWNNIPLLEKIDKEQGLIHLYFGLLLALLCYNLFLLGAVRDINYLYYALFILTSLFLDYTLLGNTYKILSGKALFYANNSIPLFLNLTNITGLLFSRSFLNTKKISKGMDRYLLGLTTVFALLIIYAMFGSYGTAIRLSMPFSLLEYVSLLIIGSFCYIKGYKAAKFYLLAFAILLAFSVVIILKTVGILPVNFFTTHAMYIGRATNTVLLAFALADRINIMRKEKETALREKLIESEKVASMSRAFQRFVPLEFLDLLQKEDVTKVVLGDYVSKEMSILFSDIRNFTALSENMTPEENFKFINSYLQRMEPSISRHNGFIDKFLGDAIMALFDRNADDAVTAAIHQQSVLAEYNEHRLNSNYPPITVGIGINTGPLMLGTIGAQERMEGTVISDAVNLASRMEGLTVKYAANILISDNTYNGLKDPGTYNIRKIDRVRVKGKTKPVTVYEVLDGICDKNKQLKLETLNIFQEGLSLYQEQKFELSMEVFKECIAKNPLDKVALLYITRCRQLNEKRDGINNFDGITDFYDKK